LINQYRNSYELLQIILQSFGKDGLSLMCVDKYFEQIKREFKMKKMPPGSKSQKKDMEDEDDDEDS
jgi:hypothetical protein